jgi:hypothetical protein
MKTLPLFRLLCELCPESNYKIAESLGVKTACTFSRLANNLTHNTATLERAAAYFSERLSAEVDANILRELVDAKTLLAVALHLRTTRLRKQKAMA